MLFRHRKSITQQLIPLKKIITKSIIALNMDKLLTPNMPQGQKSYKTLGVYM